MEKFKKTLVWSIIHNKEHPELTNDEKKISGVIPIVDKLFPGINYYSVSGFCQVKNDYLRPALTKLFPYFKNLKAEEIKGDEKVEIKEAFLPSKGYEHLDNPEWRKKLNSLLQN